MSTKLTELEQKVVMSFWTSFNCQRRPWDEKEDNATGYCCKDAAKALGVRMAVANGVMVSLRNKGLLIEGSVDGGEVSMDYISDAGIDMYYFLNPEKLLEEPK